MGDKIDAADKSNIESEINKVKEALKGTDSEAIKTATESLSKAFYAVSEKLYAQANPQGAQQEAPNGNAQQSAAGDNVYEADYRDVTDDK